MVAVQRALVVAITLVGLLRIPKIDFSTNTSFADLVGARLLDTPAGSIREAIQRNEFTLSERGARLVSAARLAADCVGAVPEDHHRRVWFDEPFLLAMIREGATRPYFLAWFENDDLFVRL